MNEASKEEIKKLLQDMLGNIDKVKVVELSADKDNDNAHDHEHDECCNFPDVFGLTLTSSEKMKFKCAEALPPKPYSTLINIPNLLLIAMGEYILACYNEDFQHIEKTEKAIKDDIFPLIFDYLKSSRKTIAEIVAADKEAEKKTA